MSNFMPIPESQRMRAEAREHLRAAIELYLAIEMLGETPSLLENPVADICSAAEMYDVSLARQKLWLTLSLEVLKAAEEDAEMEADEDDEMLEDEEEEDDD